MRRLLSAMVGAALVLSLTASAAAASSPRLVSFTINTPAPIATPGTFVATGGAPCKSGTTMDDLDRGQFFDGAAFHHLVVYKEFTCADSSAWFVLKLDVYIPQPFMGAGSHDFGTWAVDSATDTSLRGSGVFVGTYFGTDPNALGIVDRLAGVMAH